MPFQKSLISNSLLEYVVYPTIVVSYGEQLLSFLGITGEALQLQIRHLVAGMHSLRARDLAARLRCRVHAGPCAEDLERGSTTGANREDIYIYIYIFPVPYFLLAIQTQLEENASQRPKKGRPTAAGTAPFLGPGPGPKKIATNIK